MDIHRNGLMDGLGKPEKLLGQSAESSRRITSEHRPIYRLGEDRLKILRTAGISRTENTAARTTIRQEQP